MCCEVMASQHKMHVSLLVFMGITAGGGCGTAHGTVRNVLVCTALSKESSVPDEPDLPLANRRHECCLLASTQSFNSSDAAVGALRSFRSCTPRESTREAASRFLLPAGFWPI